MWGRRYWWALSAILVLALPATAYGAEPSFSLDLRGGPLGNALRSLAVQSGTSLLFSPDIVGTRSSSGISGSLSIEQALQQLLAGSGLGYRRAGPGSILIFRLPSEQIADAIPEILVVGRKTQNTDIRRTENDIQPYRVLSSSDIASSHAESVDDFLRTRLTSDEEPVGPSQNPASEYATNRSEANLHGLGANQTLVLIDGGRMPSIPSAAFDLSSGQPDLNGIPLFAIDRIEAITATAGGIYGPGATGGVLNVVLKRDYRSADLAVTTGLTDRGDGARKRIDGRIGFTPDHGRTNVMLTFSRMSSTGIRAGARSLSERARQIEASQDRTDYVLTTPSINGLFLRSLTSEPLSLKPGFGGAALGSNFTYLPAGTSGQNGASIAALLANAGQAATSLPFDGTGTERSLTSDTRVTSILASVRHRFTDGIEGFVDFMGFQNNGRAFGATEDASLSAGFISAGASNNPFQQDLIFSIPLPGFEETVRNRLETTRLTSGLIVALPKAWKAEASYSIGGVRDVVDVHGSMLNNDFFRALAFDLPGAGGEPTPDPFGNWAGFMSALQTYKTQDDVHFARRDRFQDANLRLAGPLASTKAGPIALTLLAERRHEDVPSSTYSIIQGSGAGSRTTVYLPYSQTVSSLYGEARAPIVPRTARFWPARGLEFQLAVRYDDSRTVAPANADADAPAGRFTARQSATAFTAGLRTFPTHHLMLRASAATGTLPPTAQQMLETSSTLSFPYVPDPERKGRLLGSEGAFTLLTGGSPRLRPERALTLSAGLVVDPEGGTLPRISVDFTHIEKRNEISTAYNNNVSFFLDNASLYPDRVTRAPLTAADAALGFAGGVVTAVNTTALNIGRTNIDTLDVQADYAIRIGPIDQLRLSASATWEPRLRRRVAPTRPLIDYVGWADGPLRWRWDAGADWTHGPITVGLNGQFYDHYTAVEALAGSLDQTGGAVFDVPGIHVPPQFYLDLSAAYRIGVSGKAGPVHALEFRFGIRDLLDHLPPPTTRSGLGYSYYGSPLGRRYEISVGAHF